MVGKSKKRRERLKSERRSFNQKPTKRAIATAVKVSFGTVLSVAVILLAYYYNKNREEFLILKLEETISGLLQAEEKVSVDPRTKVAVGFGSCQDVIVQSNQVLYDSAPKEPEHFYSISTREELLKTFAYFYRHGAAAERFISNSTLFGELVEIAQRSPNARYTMGGNAPVMAARFAKEGCEVLLGAQMSKELQSHLPEEVQISGPTVEKDDFHLLLEYPAGQMWGSYIPPRANRFIIHNDHENPFLSSLDKFSSQLESFHPDLLVIGGLQMMDNFPMARNLRIERLYKVRDLMKKQPLTSRVHFEMASFSDEVLLKDLIQNVVPFADSLGMNEQELPNLYHIMLYGNVSLVAESHPRVAVILDQMREVFELLQDTKETQGRRKLTRLHVHTLAFQAIMTDKDSPWKNTMSAAAKSALTAHRHTCGSDKIDAGNAKLIMDDSFTTSRKENAKRIPFETKRPVACWDEENFEICIAPVLVCTRVLQTGGGGDNVSSAGLVLQI